MKRREDSLKQWNFALNIATREEREEILDDIDTSKLEEFFKNGNAFNLNKKKIKELFSKLDKKGHSFLPAAREFVRVMKMREKIAEKSLIENLFCLANEEYSEACEDDIFENQDYDDIYSLTDFSADDEYGLEVRWIQLKNATNDLNSDQKRQLYMAISMIASILKNEQIFVDLPKLPDLPEEIKEILKKNSPV